MAQARVAAHVRETLRESGHLGDEPALCRDLRRPRIARRLSGLGDRAAGRASRVGLRPR